LELKAGMIEKAKSADGVSLLCDSAYPPAAGRPGGAAMGGAGCPRGRAGLPEAGSGISAGLRNGSAGGDGQRLWAWRCAVGAWERNNRIVE